MSDVILQQINTTLTNLGYTVSNKTLPSIREWDTVPIVTITPKKPTIEFHAFTDHAGNVAKRNVKQTYEVAYITSTDLSTTIPNAFDQFKKDIYDNFHGITSSLQAAGAWDSRVRGNEDFRSYMVPKQYNFTCVYIDVSYIEN